MRLRVIKKYYWIFLILLPAVSFSEVNPYSQLNWIVGPTTQTIDNRSTIFVPKNYVFLSVSETDKYSKISQNQPTGVEHFFAPSDVSWESYFSFDEIGYVKDDEQLDADELLELSREGDKAGNKYRKKQGWPTLTTVGWEFEPRYDSTNNLLEWAFIVQNDDTKRKSINYNTRILGRNGVMNVVLVATPDVLHAAVSDFKVKVKGFKFNSGDKYSEYREGDRVAEFGLAALIAGGAAALASKKGFWATILSFLVASKNLVIAAVIGLFAWLVSLFRRKK